MFKLFRNNYRADGFYCVFYLISVFALSCGILDQTEDNEVIVVGSRHITVDELKRDIEFIGAGMDGSNQKGDLIRKQLVEQIIDHYLIMEYGKERGISVSQEELQVAMQDITKEYSENAFKDALLRGYVGREEWKDRLKEQILVNKIVQTVTDSVSPPSHQDIKRVFEENRDEFRSPRMLEFRQIVVRTAEDAGDILRRLQDGEDMRALAREYSIAPEAEDGGYVGWVSKGHLEESMDKALFSTPQGEFSPVIETPYGYHIFEVISARPEGKKELPEVISEIESRLLSQRREEFYREWIAEIRAHFNVKVNQGLLNSLGMP